MTAILLALVSALAYGVSDFIGGLVSRWASAWSVAILGNFSAAVCVAAVAATVPGQPRTVDFMWAVLAGVASGAGTGFLYRGLAAGRMGVVAPVSAVGAAAVPVLVGVGGGERPALLVWLGIIVALPGIWLVARDPTARHDDRPGFAHGLGDGLLAGLGFGLLFAALGQIPAAAGLWPLTLAQWVSLPTIVVLAAVVGGSWLPRVRAAWWALLAGPLGALATWTFMVSTQRGFLTVSGILASLYPAATVMLAALILRERVHRAQGVGLGLCALAVALVAAG